MPPQWRVIVVASALMTVAVLLVVTRMRMTDSATPARPVPTYAEARAIVDRHCVTCHSAHPVIAAFPIAPGGVMLDTPAQMREHAERMRVRTVVDKSMPLLNKTGMADAERHLLGAWIAAGAIAP